MKLNAQQLTVSYRVPGTADFTALSDVSFGVQSGQLVAVVGPNGSGKTTLLRALLGLERPGAGEVLLEQQPIGRYSRRQLAELIGALPQREEPAFPLTVREVLLMGRWARLGPVAAVSATDEQAMRDALARCDMAGFEDRNVETLSGGEWQRVRIARALATQPRLLLLDEPTSALDIGHEMALFELLRVLVADGLGILVVTHQLNLAAQFADQLLLLKRGRTIAAGPPSEAMRADVLSEVFDWPVSVIPSTDGTPHVVPLRRTF
jgi:ABC-type cobalamin/Fe3+-siderophores transport system ATPase subunit